MLNPFTPAKVALGLVNLGLLSAMLAAWAWVIYRLATRQRLLPPTPPRFVPWEGKAVLAVLLTYLGLQAVVPSLYIQLVFAPQPGVKVRAGPTHQLLVMILISLPFLALAWAILRRWSGARATDFGLELRRAPMEFFYGLMAWPILAPIVFGVNFVVLKLLKTRVPHPIEDLAGQNPSPLTWGMMFFAAAIVAPIAEEFLFRGVLLGWLSRVATGRSKPGLVVVDDLGEPVETPVAFLGLRLFLANLVISLVFAAMHGQIWPTPIPLFLLAMGLGLLYQRTGGLIAPIALHMTFNGISTLVLYLVTMAGGLDALKQELKAIPNVAPNAIVLSPVETTRSACRTLKPQNQNLDGFSMDTFPTH